MTSFFQSEVHPSKVTCLHILTCPSPMWHLLHACDQTARIHFYAVNQNVCVCDLQIPAREPVERRKTMWVSRLVQNSHVTSITCVQVVGQRAKIWLYLLTLWWKTCHGDSEWAFHLKFTGRLVPMHVKWVTCNSKKIEKVFFRCASIASTNKQIKWLWSAVHQGNVTLFSKVFVSIHISADLQNYRSLICISKKKF